MKNILLSVFATLICTLFAVNGFSQETVRLQLYWSAERTDNASMAGESEQWARDGRYIDAGTLGYILKNPEPGTIPLKLFWSEQRADNATMAGSVAEQNARDAGYREAATLGHIYTTQRPGTVPLKLYWSGPNADNMTVPEGKDQGAINAGYEMARILGYIYVNQPSTARMTRFNPSVHGFRFRNDFITNFAGINFSGLCGGMAYSALDYFNNGISIPTQTSTPAEGTPLRQYIYNRQQNSTFDNLDKWGELTINPFGQRTAEFFNWGLQGSGGGRLQELRGEIDAGRPVPLGLYKGGNSGFVTHHQVLAIGYDLGRYTGDLGQNKADLKIFVYDSNFPGQTKVLRPNLSNLTYYYESDPTCSWLTYFVDRKYRLASPPR